MGDTWKDPCEDCTLMGVGDDTEIALCEGHVHEGERCPVKDAMQINEQQKEIERLRTTMVSREILDDVKSERDEATSRRSREIEKRKIAEVNSASDRRALDRLITRADITESDKAVLETENATLKKEVEELKEFRNTRDMVVEIVKTSACSGADIRSVFADITRFKKSQKELAETEAIEAKSSETETAALKKQIAELEYQQEADTGTIGILADVVDVLWEDDGRCEKHGCGDVVAKAREVVGRRELRDEGMSELRTHVHGLVEAVPAIIDGDLFWENDVGQTEQVNPLNVIQQMQEIAVNIRSILGRKELS